MHLRSLDLPSLLSHSSRAACHLGITILIYDVMSMYELLFFFETDQSAMKMPFVSKFRNRKQNKVFPHFASGRHRKTRLLDAVKITFLIEKILCVAKVLNPDPIYKAKKIKRKKSKRFRLIKSSSG